MAYTWCYKGSGYRVKGGGGCASVHSERVIHIKLVGVIAGERKGGLFIIVILITPWHD